MQATNVSPQHSRAQSLQCDTAFTAAVRLATKAMDRHKPSFARRSGFSTAMIVATDRREIRIDEVRHVASVPAADLSGAGSALV
jgi:hypothetical protein